MIKHAKELFNELLKEAIDCTTIPYFMDYKNMTSNYAERAIIGLLKKNTLYRYEDRIFIRRDDKLCYVILNKKKNLPNVGAYPEWVKKVVIPEEDSVESVRVILPFSPKWICKGMYKCRDIRTISDYFVLNQIIESLID